MRWCFHINQGRECGPATSPPPQERRPLSPARTAERESKLGLSGFSSSRDFIEQALPIFGWQSGKRPSIRAPESDDLRKAVGIAVARTHHMLIKRHQTYAFQLGNRRIAFGFFKMFMQNGSQKHGVIAAQAFFWLRRGGSSMRQGHALRPAPSRLYRQRARHRWRGRYDSIQPE